MGERPEWQRAMDKQPISDNDLIARLQAYEVVSNQHDIDAALAMFTEDGCIEVGDKQYCGLAALRAAHEYDLASRTRVTFGDFVVNGDTVACKVVYCDELDRAVGLDGLHRRATFTFRDGRIHKFVLRN